MTIIQALGLVIGLLSLLVSAELARASAAARRRRAETGMAVGFRNVGTFGSSSQFAPETLGIPSTGSAARTILSILLMVLFVGTGITVWFGYKETHPDIRSAYGRAYERCVNEKRISRWKVNEVDRCVSAERSTW